ncbi:MAG: DUF3987 domain-containing protein [Candidatus Bipolaricaulota bacterium]
MADQNGKPGKTVEEMDLFSMMPRKGFFPEYVRYATELTDAPQIYHLAAALSLHSAVFGHMAEVQYLASNDGDGSPASVPAVEGEGDRRERKIRWSPLHLWTLLIGESGDRKTTALNKAEDLLDMFAGGRKGGIAGSPEATFDVVSNQPASVFWYPEGATFFSMFFANYWKHGQGVFPQLYDGRDINRTVSGGRRTPKNPNPKPYQVKIKQPRVTLSVAVALGHIENAQNSDWTGGLIARMMIFHAKRTVYQDGELHNETGRQRLRAMLQKVQSELYRVRDPKTGVFPLKMHAEANRVLAEWGRLVNEAGQKRPDRIRSIFNRIPDHVLRVAAHYAISQGYNAVNVETAEAAVNLGNAMILSTDRVSELLSTDRVDRMATAIRDFVAQEARGRPGQPVSVLSITKALRLSAATLDPALKSLITTGELRSVAIQGYWGKYVMIPESTPPPPDAT